MGNQEVILETKELTKSFGGLTAVDHVSFSLRRGEIRALIGPNGAGKTTLFNLIAGVLKPTSGQVFFKGKDITTLPPYKRVKLKIGRSFQLINIFPGLSVRENVEIGTQAFFKRGASPLEIIGREGIRSRAEGILGEFGLAEHSSVKAGAIVYGDQKKLEAVLALASEPELLLLDEPAAGTDEKGVSLIIELIKVISRDRTVLLTDHDVKFVMKIADVITVLDRGRIIAEGPPSEISGNEEVEAAYLGGIV
ncbi:Lipopolysaccharide export system ATP-binding protein LptB [subsurface metagenome]